MITILVIEDERAVRENIIELLNIEGFDPIGAENGDIGVRLALEHVPDLIVCDVMMPKVDGYGVLKALRSQPMTATIPFIFLTAKAAKEDWRQAMKLGADDYLTKPFSRAELLDAIATRLEKQAAQREHYQTTAINQVATTLNSLDCYDSLTKLPNRRWLREQLHHSLPPADNNQQVVPFLCLGLDRFNRINDNMGFAFGDLVLCSVAERIKNCVIENDIVVRLNNDQFAIILRSINQKKDAANFAQLILDVLAKPFNLNGYEIFITASIGISFYPSDSDDIDNLIKQTSAAIHDAKRKGGNNYQFYTKEINIVISEPLALENDLRYALEREQLNLYYQPQLDLRTEQIVGVEALIRWHHPKRGMVSPGIFIPLAEEIGLIIPIGEWVLRTACAQAKAWQVAGHTSLKVSVNLSVYQLNDPNLIKKICDVLNQTDFQPNCLELELTESILVQNPEAVSAIFLKLKELGVKISIDDFGTGYSSLGYLQQFTFDTLKIDQCFIRGLHKNDTNAAITKALIQMAKSLNLEVISEGVETEAEEAFLRQHQCDIIQGYWFSRPLPVEELSKLLKKL